MSLRFASTIQFVSAGAFAALKAQTPRPKDLNIHQIPFAEIQGSAKQLQTEGIKMCNAGGIQNGLSGVMFHILAAHRVAGQFDKIKNTFDSLLNRFQRIPDTPFRALLVGGHNHDSDSQDCQSMILEKLHLATTPYSRFWGHKNGFQSDLHYDVATDTWNIHSYKRLNNEAPQPKSMTEVLQRYHIVNIAPGDRLELQGRA